MEYRITTDSDLTDRHRALTSVSPRAPTASRTRQPSFGGTAEGPLLEACDPSILHLACVIPVILLVRPDGLEPSKPKQLLYRQPKLPLFDGRVRCSVDHGFPTQRVCITFWDRYSFMATELEPRVTSGDRTHLPGFTVQCLNHFGFGHHDAPWILPAVSQVLTRDFSATYTVITVRLRGSSRRGQYTIRTCGPRSVNAVLFR